MSAEHFGSVRGTAPDPLELRQALDLKHPGLRAYLALAEQGRIKHSRHPIVVAGKLKYRDAEPDIISTVLETGVVSRKQWMQIHKWHSRHGRGVEWAGKADNDGIVPERWLLKRGKKKYD